MPRAVPKAANGRTPAGNVCPSVVVDSWPDGVVVKVLVSDELLGAMMRGKVDHFLVAIIGDEWERHLKLAESRLAVVK